MEDPFVPDEFHAAEGRTVVLQIADGEYRPAQIVKCWGDPDSPAVAVNLIVFLDGSNDARYLPGSAGLVLSKADIAAGGTCGYTAWATSRVQGPGVGQWRTRRPR